MAKKRTGHYAKAYDIKGPEDAIALYESWAASYDADMSGDYGYAGPRETSEEFARHCPDRGAFVLDVGCGTGLAGVELKRLGYEQIDGLDISPAMLAEAKKKGVYRELIEADLTGKLSIPDDTYDAVISVGTFTHGHVGTEGLAELVRIVKPGGVICFSIHEDVYEEYGFEAAFEDLAKAGKAELIDTAHRDYVRGTEAKAWIASLRVR